MVQHLERTGFLLLRQGVPQPNFFDLKHQIQRHYCYMNWSSQLLGRSTALSVEGTPFSDLSVLCLFLWHVKLLKMFIVACITSLVYC